MTRFGLVAKLCPILCNPMDYCPPGSSVPGILQARILEQVAISFSRGSFQPRDQIHISHAAGSPFISEPPALFIFSNYLSKIKKKKLYINFLYFLDNNILFKVAQSCPIPCDPIDCSTPGSSIHGIFQARILEWVAISFSRGSFQPRGWTQISALQADSLPSEPPRKPYLLIILL